MSQDSKFLVENFSEKNDFQQIVLSLKTSLLSNQSFDKNLMIDQAKKITKLFLQNDPNTGYKTFLENNTFLFENIFEIFISTNKVDTIFVLSKLRLDITQVTSKLKSKFKDANRFNPWFLTKLIECSNHFYNNWNFTDNNKDNYIDINLFNDFMSDYISYIYSEIKDRSLSKLCFILAIDLLNISQSLFNKKLIRLVNDIIYKNNFYILKDYSDETQKALKLLINLAVKIEESTNFDSQNDRDYFDALNSCFETFVARIEQTSNLDENLKIINEILLEKLIFEPIESNYVSNEYFYLINNFMAFVSYQFFPDDKKSIHKLKLIYEKVLSVDIFESINSNDDDFRNRNQYYSTFFEKISEIIPKRQDISIELTDNFIQLLNLCLAKNEFKNPFDEDQYTIFYHVCQKLTLNVSETDFLNESLVDKCCEFWFHLWFELYEKNEFNSNLASFFNVFFNAATRNYRSAMASKANKLWKIYLVMKEAFLLQSICEIFPLSIDIFAENYSIKFASLILTNDRNYLNPISQNYIALIKLAEFFPEFFFQNIPGKEINIIEIFNNSKNNQNELIVAIGTIYRLFQTLNSKGLSKEYENIAFNNRRKFFGILFVEGEKKLNENKRTIFVIPHYTFDLLTRTICDYYNFLGRNIYEKQSVKLLIDDLIEIFEEIKSKDVAICLFTIENIGKSNNKQNHGVLKDYYEYFLKLKKDTQLLSINEIDTNLSLVINYIEGKNLETFTKQLDQNTTNIFSLEKKTLKQEIKLTNINKNIDKLNDKVEVIEQKVDEQEDKIEIIDGKTLYNLPLWCKDISKKLESIKKSSWILVAKRLNFNDKDIKGWQNQVDPCMSMLQEWFIINKTSDAITGLLKTFQELHYADCVKIIEENQNYIENKNASDNIILNEENLDRELVEKPPQIFICFEWSSKEKAELLRKHLVSFFSNENKINHIRIWFDDGQMGGGNSRNNRMDIGLRSCYVLICLISKEIVNDKTCLNQINLAVQLNKTIIPLLIDNKLKWPPQGSLGPIMSEYLFIRFFQRPPKELTNDERYWPVDKFNELVMQIRQLVPLSLKSEILDNSLNKKFPEIFISYQWDKQKDIINLYHILTNMGLTVWLDINQMAGGDSLYDKIDNGLRNCDLVISCVTTKYGLSANCRKEIALADSLPKPIIPILLEKEMKYPPPGPMAPTLSILKYIDFTKNYDENNFIMWKGDAFNDLLERMKSHLSKTTIEKVQSKACTIS